VVLSQRPAVHQPQTIFALKSGRNNKEARCVHVGFFSKLPAPINLFLTPWADFEGVSNVADGGIPMVLTKFLKHIGNDSQGATAVEYGLILSLVVLAMIGALQSVGTSNTNQWGTVSDETSNVMDNLDFGN
jgi:pilus assembly protein Flp/PilA